MGETVCQPHVIWYHICKAIPIQAWTGLWGVQEVEAPRISRKSPRESDKVVSCMIRPPLSTGDAPGAYICWRVSRPKGQTAAGGMELSQWKITMTPSGILLATFRLVAQSLNRIPHLVTYIRLKIFPDFEPCLNPRRSRDSAWSGCTVAPLLLIADMTRINHTGR